MTSWRKMRRKDLMECLWWQFAIIHLVLMIRAYGVREFLLLSVSAQVVSHLTKLRLTIGYTCPLFTTPTALVYCRIRYNWTRPLWKLPSEGSDWTEKRDKWWKCTPCDLFNMECIVLLMELHLQHAEHLWSINYKHDCKF